MTCFRNADSVHAVKTKIQAPNNLGRQYMPPLASDKIRLWFRVTVLIILLMTVDKLESLLLILQQ